MRAPRTEGKMGFLVLLDLVGTWRLDVRIPLRCDSFLAIHVHLLFVVINVRSYSLVTCRGQPPGFLPADVLLLPTLMMLPSVFAVVFLALLLMTMLLSTPLVPLLDRGLLLLALEIGVLHNTRLERIHARSSCTVRIQWQMMLSFTMSGGSGPLGHAPRSCQTCSA